MSVLTPQIVDEFWQICNAAYECWLGHRGLFDDNANLEQLGGSHCAAFLAHLSIVTQRDTLQQIAKLHDPAKQFGQNNLSIAYVVDNGLWDRETRMRLSVLKGKLDAFAELLRQARNKIIAHNDVAARLLRPALGGFPDGADIEYFNNLQAFVDIVAGEPRPFNDLVRNDARVFVEALTGGSRPVR
jgi:AbiU2